MARFGTGRDLRVQRGDKGAMLFALRDQVQHVTGIASQPVEARHHRFVAGAQKAMMVASSAGCLQGGVRKVLGLASKMRCVSAFQVSFGSTVQPGEQRCCPN